MRKILALMAATASGLLLSAADAADTTAPKASPVTVAAPAVAGATAAKQEANGAKPEASAAAPATGSPAPAAADSVSQVSAKGPPIVAEAGKGTLIRLPKPASTVFIANPDIADVQVKSPTLIYLTAKSPGETVLYAVDANDHVLMNSPVRVDHDLSRVRQTLNAIAPGEDVKVSSVDNSLVLSGKVKSAGDADKVQRFATSIAKETKGDVVNRLSVATPNQINIRVKVAEIDRTVLKDLGFNWTRIGDHVKFSTANGPVITPENALVFALGGASSQLIGTLNLLGTEGLLTTLAEPNLTATNGQPASFLAGGEFPVPTLSGGNVSGTTTGVVVSGVEFKKFGVQLDVVPTIVDAEHLSMRIRTSVSQLSSNGAVTLSGFFIPALTERSAETTVELGSGQSFLLGGLLSNQITQNISKVPALGDIPVLGQLFRSESFKRDESELVIVVTPYLVKPTLTSLALPTDGFVPPHDAQRVINGDRYRQGLPAPARALGPSGEGLIGPVGFRLD